MDYPAGATSCDGNTAAGVHALLNKSCHRALVAASANSGDMGSNLISRASLLRRLRLHVCHNSEVSEPGALQNLYRYLRGLI
jgi:hypothetical protein